MKRLSKLYLVLLLIFSSNLYGWENKFTHPAITQEAVTNSNAQVDSYLKDALGLSNGLNAQLQYDFPDDIKIRISRGSADGNKKNRSILEWLKVGSTIEDTDDNPDPRRAVAPWRPRHHFYDPNRNTGLDNHTDHPDWTAPFWSSWLPLGQSALDWAITGTAIQEPTTNNNRWEDARDAFYDALTSSVASDRDSSLAETFLNLGNVLHLLEDMGVPAHARNDFLNGHYRTWVDNGNLFEWRVEQQVKDNGGQIPNTMLTGWTPQVRVFSKLADYWDPDLYTGQYLGDGNLPPNDWGLAECTNYQFLSDSTVFIDNVGGTLYYFPNPAKEHVSDFNDPSEDYYGKRKYVQGYGIDCLARKTFIERYVYDANHYPSIQRADIVGYDVDYDENIYQDYAQVTIPRTIDYVTGLANYFFRGKISAEQTGCNGSAVEITIKNVSKNSNVEQVLKGGEWTLYWDDQDGNRTPVSGTINYYAPDGSDWGSSKVLDYNQTTKMNFTLVTPPTGKTVEQYVLIYRGPINDKDHPSDTDSDDNQALATTTFGTEITRQLEDIRRDLFVLWTMHVPVSVYSTTYSNIHQYELDDTTYSGYVMGDVVGNDGMYWVAVVNQNAHVPPLKSNWQTTQYWLPYADSTKYLNFCRNSLYYLSYYCSHSDCLDESSQNYFPKASTILPTQVWQLTNCTHFAAWVDAHDYKVGDKIRVTDDVFAHQGMVVGYICTVAHTSLAVSNKPTANFLSPDGKSVWRQYGDPVEVSDESLISANVGSKNSDMRGLSGTGSPINTPYLIESGWPPGSTNTLHNDVSYVEYQSAVERACESSWMFGTEEANYYWKESVGEKGEEGYLYNDGPLNGKPKIALGDDWRWNCNRSCFELILQLMGKYDWYWDASYYPIKWSSDPSSHDVGCHWCTWHGGTVPPLEGNNVINPAHPVWRKTWRYTMNRHAGTQKNHATISDSHNEQLPPYDFGTNEEPALTNHTNLTLKDMTCNSVADMLNDMREALSLCTRLQWNASIQWEHRTGTLGLNTVTGDSASEVYTKVDEGIRADLAAKTWTGEYNTPQRITGCRAKWSFPLSKWEYYTTEGSITEHRLTITVAAPPRGGMVLDNGIQIRSYGICNPTPNVTTCEHLGGSTVQDNYWACASGPGLPVFTTKMYDYFECFDCPLPIGAGTVVHIFTPPTGVLVPTCPIPYPCGADTCQKNHEHISSACEQGAWSVDAGTFYYMINKDIPIF